MYTGKDEEEYYKFLLYKAIENESTDMLKLIPIEYIPFGQFDYTNQKFYEDRNSLLNIKFVKLFHNNPIIFKICTRNACRFDRLDMIKYLIKNNSELNFFELVLNDCAFGNVDIIKYFIECGNDIHLEDDFALRLAIEKGYSDIVRYLVKAGADIHVGNDFALRNALYNDDYDLIKFLIEHGANTNVNGGLVLEFAVLNNNFDLFKLCIKHGADIYVKDSYIFTLTNDIKYNKMYLYLLDVHLKNISINL